MPKYRIKADITLSGAEIIVDCDDPIEDEDDAQHYINVNGLGSNDFNLHVICDEEIEAYDVEELKDPKPPGE